VASVVNAIIHAADGMAKALVGFKGRGFADGVQPGFFRSLFLEVLIFQ